VSGSPQEGGGGAPEGSVGARERTEGTPGAEPDAAKGQQSERHGQFLHALRRQGDMLSSSKEGGRGLDSHPARRARGDRWQVLTDPATQPPPPH
jgi:hypothetical protein